MKIRNKIIPIFILLMLFFSGVTVIMPVSEAVIIYPGVVFSCHLLSGYWENYTVSRVMNFSQIQIKPIPSAPTCSYAMFNSTFIIPYNYWSSNYLYVFSYMNDDFSSSTFMERVLSFNYTCTVTPYFYVGGFKNSWVYRVYRNGVNWTSVSSDSSGQVAFSTISGSNINLTFYDYYASADTTKPSIILNFAGNRNDMGGPYWLPPEESTALSGVNLNGYYTNDSYQNESWIYINATATDNIGVSSVVLHWYDVTAGTWDNTSSLALKGTSFYEINKTVTLSHKYSFDLLVSDAAGNTRLIWWNKTGVNGSLTRRCVYLKNIKTNISYTPLYFYNATDLTTDISYNMDKKDRLMRDQGWNQGLTDAGYLISTIPTNAISLRLCTNYVYYWYNNDSCIQPITLNNVYLHYWINMSDTDWVIFLARTRGHATKWPTDRCQYLAYESEQKSSLVRNLIGFGDVKFVLDVKLLNYNLSASAKNFDDNSIFENIIYFQNNYTHGIGAPIVMSNRSYTSFILFNVPSNATLGSTDSDGDGLTDVLELYTVFTNPFLADTDNDGVTDYTEYYQGSDPNNYTSIVTPTYTVPVVDTNDATGVEEQNATLRGTLLDDGETDITSAGFQYGTTTSYGTTKDLAAKQYYNQTLYDDSILMATGGYSTRVAYRNKSFTGKLTNVSWYLKKSGWPTGNLYCRIRYVSNDTLIEQSGTILDSSTVTGAPTWYKFIFTNTTYLSSEDVYMNLEYSPTHAGLHFIWCLIKASPDVDGYHYISSYNLYGTATVKTEYITSYSSPSLLSYDLIGLSQGTLYHFRVYATNIMGTSYGVDKSFITKPNEPSGFIITNTGTNNNQLLSWTHGTGYDSTVVHAAVGAYPATPQSGIGIYNASGATVTVNNTFLTPGTVYYYRAWEYAGEGGLRQFSDGYSSTIGLTKPYAPTSTDILVNSPTSLTLHWVKGTASNNTVIRYKSTGTPTSPTDGTLVYNGTGTSTSVTVVNGSVYYYAGFGYTKQGAYIQYSDNGTNFINISGVGFTINAYSQYNNTNITFNVLITNPDGSQTYTKNGCINPTTINASLCPNGQNIQIIISATGYRTGTYIINLYPGIIYQLNAYLPPIEIPGGELGENYTRTYRLRVIDEFTSPVSDAFVTIKKYMNNTDSFEMTGNLYTNGYGEGDIWLMPSTYYKVYVEKSGFISISGDDWQTDPIFYGANYPKIFQMTHENITPPVSYVYGEEIIFNGYINRTSNILYLNFTDNLGQTIDTNIFVYEINEMGDRVLFSTDNKVGINSFQLTITGINNSCVYEVILVHNHTFFDTQRTTLIFDSLIIHPITPAVIDDIFTTIIGVIPFGGSNLCMFLVFMAICFYVDSRDAGKIIIVMGVIFMFVGGWIGANTTLFGSVGAIAGGALPVLFIVIGILMEWNNSKRRG